MKNKSKKGKKPFAYSPPGTSNSNRSVALSVNSDNSSVLSSDGGMNGERVKVAVRIRPLMKHEKGHK